MVQLLRLSLSFVKYNCHLNRWQNIHPVVSFTGETEFSDKKEEFLSRYTKTQTGPNNKWGTERNILYCG